VDQTRLAAAPRRASRRGATVIISNAEHRCRRPHAKTSFGSLELRNLAKTPAAYFIECRDGLKVTMLMLDGAVKDFNFVARLKGGGAVNAIPADVRRALQPS